MSTITLSSSSWSEGQIRITYTALNGSLKITEIEGKRSSTRSWNENYTSISVSVGGTSKSISLSHYVDFNTSWVAWEATDTTWTELKTKSITISIKMNSGTQAYSGCTFTGNATMSWDTKLTVNYYSNFATSYGGTYDVENAVSSDINVLVHSHDYYYESDYSTYGVANYSGSGGSLYMTRDGYTGTGIWGTAIDGGIYQIDEDDLSYTSGYELAKALGKDISTSNASINLYPQWSENVLTVNYYSNYATSAFEGALNPVSATENVLVKTNFYYYDNDYSANGLENYSNIDGEVYMARAGYFATGYWGTSIDEVDYYINENTGFSTGQSIAQVFDLDLTDGDKSIDVYAQWEPANIIYYNNNGTYILCNVYGKIDGSWQPRLLYGKINGIYKRSVITE